MQKIFSKRMAKIVSTVLLVWVGIIFVVPHKAFASTNFSSGVTVPYTSPDSGDTYQNFFYGHGDGSTSFYVTFFNNADTPAASTTWTNFTYAASTTVNVLGGIGTLDDSGSVVASVNPSTTLLGVTYYCGVVSGIGMAVSCAYQGTAHLSTIQLYDGSFASNMRVFDFYGGSGYIPPMSSYSCLEGVFGNCFASSTPPGDSINASSTEFQLGFTGYAEQSGTITISLVQNTGSLACANAVDVSDALQCTVPSTSFVIPVSVGDFSVFATTSIQNNGIYYVRGAMSNSGICLFGLCTGQQTLLSTSSPFTIGEPTAADVLYGQVLSAAGVLGSASSTIDWSICNPLNWIASSTSFPECVQALVIPNNVLLSDDINNLQTYVLQKWPLGYVDRMYTLINATTSTSSLPVLAVTIPSGYPGAGERFDLTPWGYLMGSGSYLATATSSSDGLTLEQSFDPYWDDFWNVVFAFTVFFTLLGFRNTGTALITDDDRRRAIIREDGLNTWVQGHHPSIDFDSKRYKRDRNI